MQRIIDSFIDETRTANKSKENKMKHATSTPERKKDWGKKGNLRE